MSVYFRKKRHGEICEGIQFPKLSAVGDRLNVTVFFGYMPKTSSSCEFNAKWKKFTFCDHVSYSESKIVREICSVFYCYFLVLRLTMVRTMYVV